MRHFQKNFFKIKGFSGFLVFFLTTCPWQMAGMAKSAGGELQPLYEGEPVTLDLVDVSLVDFFRTVSELSGLNVLIDPDVEGQISIHVEEVPWDQLFEVVLRSHRLQRSIEGNLVRISTKATLQSEEEAKEALKKAALLAADTLTITKRLNYAVGKDLVETLTPQLTLERGLLNADTRTNTLIITDIPEVVQQISALVETLDVPEKQVEIEARIIEVTTNFSRELGVQLGVSVGRTTDRVQAAGLVSARIEDPVGASPGGVRKVSRLGCGRCIDRGR